MRVERLCGRGESKDGGRVGRCSDEQGKRRLLFWQSENLTLDIAISTGLSDALKRLRTCISVHL